MRRVPLALLRACHPGPCAVVTAVAVLLGAAVGYPPERLVLLGVVILTGQLSVGWSNDWLDVARDRAVGRLDKPLARGDAPLPVVRGAAFAALGASVLLGAALGWAALAVHAVTLVAAWAYNLGAKRTVWSPLPYLVAFGLLPAIVTLGLVPPRLPVWWMLVAGALLGLAAHLSNVLPDLDDDSRTGVRGLPHMLGARVAGIVTFSVLAASAVLLCLAPGLPPGPALLAAGVAGLGLASWGLAAVLRRSPTRLLMRLVMAAAIVDVAMLAIAGTSLLES